MSGTGTAVQQAVHDPQRRSGIGFHESRPLSARQPVDDDVRKLAGNCRDGAPILKRVSLLSYRGPEKMDRDHSRQAGSVIFRERRLLSHADYLVAGRAQRIPAFLHC
jgi:hypothetical protein